MKRVWFLALCLILILPFVMCGEVCDEADTNASVLPCIFQEVDKKIDVASAGVVWDYEANYPNPFNLTATVSVFQIEKESTDIYLTLNTAHEVSGSLIEPFYMSNPIAHEASKATADKDENRIGESETTSSVFNRGFGSVCRA